MSPKTFPTDKASLEKYEKRVQNFTLGRLEKEWEAVKDDPMPERRDIVAKELHEWDKTQKQAFRGLAKTLLFVFLGLGGCVTEYVYLFVAIIKRMLGAPPHPEIIFADYLPYYSYSCTIVCLTLYFFSIWGQKGSSFFDINKIKEFGHIVITEAFSVFFIANGLVGIVFGHYYGFFVTPGPIVSRIISSIIIALSIFYFYNYHADKYKGFLFKSAIPLILISLVLEQIGRLTIL